MFWKILVCVSSMYINVDSIGSTFRPTNWPNSDFIEKQLFSKVDSIGRKKYCGIAEKYLRLTNHNLSLLGNYFDLLKNYWIGEDWNCLKSLGF